MQTVFRKSMWTALVACFVFANSAVADHHGEKKAIKQAVHNYVSAIYEMKPELIEESVSPKVQKMGYMPATDGSGLAESWMTFDELKELAANINKDGMFDPETSPRDVSVYDHTDTIASVKLTAAWGIDYIHLSKHSGKWMIMNVIWEMPTG